MFLILSIIFSLNISIAGMCENTLMFDFLDSNDPDKNPPGMCTTDQNKRVTPIATSTFYMMDDTVAMFIRTLIETAAHPGYSSLGIDAAKRDASTKLNAPVCNTVIGIMKDSTLAFYFKPSVMLDQFQDLIPYCLNQIADNITAFQLEIVLRNFASCRINGQSRHNALTLEKGKFSSFLLSLYDEMKKLYTETESKRIICETAGQMLTNRAQFFKNNRLVFVDEFASPISSICSTSQLKDLMKILKDNILNAEIDNKPLFTTSEKKEIIKEFVSKGWDGFLNSIIN